MDRDFAIVLYRALCMITRYLEKRYGLGNHTDLPNYETKPQIMKENGV